MSGHEAQKNETTPRVVFLIEDSLPNGRVGPELTPTLWSLIQEGGWNPDGGVSVLASSTYPNHATFATGRDVASHRIFTNDIWDGHKFVCSSSIGPVGDTVFTAARRAGRSTAAVVGDQTMVGCMGAAEADVHWPPLGKPIEGIEVDCLGYAANQAVIDALANSDALDTDILYLHMNDPDSTLHLYGPDAPETIERIREIDDDLASVVELLKPRWDDTVLFVVSDHEQEAVNQDVEPIDLAAELDVAGLPGHAHNEGTIGIVYASPGVDAIRQLAPIEDAIDLDQSPDGKAITLAWSGPGRVFGRSNKTLAGQHGSPRTRTQVATVSGGHPMVGDMAKFLAAKRPHATDYARLISNLLDLPLNR